MDSGTVYCLASLAPVCLAAPLVITLFNPGSSSYYPFFNPGAFAFQRGLPRTKVRRMEEEMKRELWK